MRRAVTIFFWMACCFSSREAVATHIVGGELNYAYLGGDSYEITLKITRDCHNSLTPFDALASIGVFDVNNNFLFQVLVSPEDSMLLPNTTDSPCLIAPTNICYTQAYYYTTVNLPPRLGGYQLAYQRCCRNNSISNIANVASTGATYYATVPDRTIAPANSNPVFENLPATFICRNEPFVFNNYATDADGDSLVYQMCVPFNGASQSLPVPQPPANPPYTGILWQSTYTFANPMGGTALAIDPETGVLTATPRFNGQYVYGVSVKEYRNGVYLGETRRDIQVNVTSCPRIVTAAMNIPAYQCGNNTVHFTNISSGALTYRWDFGIAAAAADTSVVQSPDFLFPDTGQYEVTLVATSSLNSSCRDTSIRQVILRPALEAAFHADITSCNDTVQFSDNSSLNNGPIVYWNWDFGDGTQSNHSSEEHVYQQGGYYTVRLASRAQNGCADTIVQTVDVPVLPESDFLAMTDSCIPEVVLINRSQRASAYQWFMGDGSLSVSSSPTHVYKEEGPYEIMLVEESRSACFDTSTEAIVYSQYELLYHYIPNSFSPNGDGRNDLFYLSGASICEPGELIIYDRWGKRVFQTTDISLPWDGSYGGGEAAPGVYVYFLVGKDYTRKGTITLIR